jgi:hypothetical protein
MEQLQPDQYQRAIEIFLLDQVTGNDTSMKIGAMQTSGTRFVHRVSVCLPAVQKARAGE